MGPGLHSSQGSSQLPGSTVRRRSRAQLHGLTDQPHSKEINAFAFRFVSNRNSLVKHTNLIIIDRDANVLRATSESNKPAWNSLIFSTSGWLTFVTDSRGLKTKIPSVLGFQLLDLLPSEISCLPSASAGIVPQPSAWPGMGGAGHVCPSLPKLLWCRPVRVAGTDVWEPFP